MLTAFYQTAAQLCFTLLGLWWLVLQTKYGEWIGDRSRRRQATSISFYFLLPGAMSLIALLGANIPLLWRTTFAIACGLGALATNPLWNRRRVQGAVTRLGVEDWIAVIARWVGVALFVAIFIISVAPQLATTLVFVPLFASGVGLSLLVVLGVSLAWLFFIEPPPSK